MRALLLALLILPLVPGTQAFGVTAPAAELILDAPLLAPVVVATPGTQEPAPVQVPPGDATPAEPTGGVDAPLDLLALDALADAPVKVTLAWTAPRAMEGHPASGKLARMERADAPLPPRTPPPAPVGLDRPTPKGSPLMSQDATPALVISMTGAARAPPRAEPMRAQTFPPPAPVDHPSTWQVIATISTLLALLAPIALYHRIRARHLGRSDTRQDLLRLIEENPGLSASEISRTMALDVSTTLYHLRRLARAQFVVAEGPERRPRWFLAGSQEAPQRARVVAERRGEHVLAAIRASPGLHKSRLARGLAISRAAADWHLVTLERAGLVRLERKASRVHVFPISF